MWGCEEFNWNSTVSVPRFPFGTRVFLMWIDLEPDKTGICWPSTFDFLIQTRAQRWTVKQVWLGVFHWQLDRCFGSFGIAISLLAGVGEGVPGFGWMDLSGPQLLVGEKCSRCFDLESCRSGRGPSYLKSPCWRSHCRHINNSHSLTQLYFIHARQ